MTDEKNKWEIELTLKGTTENTLTALATIAKVKRIVKRALREAGIRDAILNDYSAMKVEGR